MASFSFRVSFLAVPFLYPSAEMISDLATCWVMVEPRGVESDDDLGEWIQRAVKFVKTLPTK